MNRRDHDDDWQPGDIALCVRGGRLPVNMGSDAPNGYPTTGRPYLVETVSKVTLDGVYKQALFLKDAPRNHSGQRVWAALRFIKVTPPADMKEDEEVLPPIKHVKENV